tara:strand:- start:697 stop:1029 length:333 start_codon:yes stop_codon:yes gene_type:complete
MVAVGQIPQRAEIFIITNSLPCTITTVEDEHGFVTGDLVRLTDLNGMMPYPHGMDPLNNYKFEIVVTLPDTFYLKDPITHKDIDSTLYTPYFTGGSANKVPTTFIYYGEA